MEQNGSKLMEWAIDQLTRAGVDRPEMDIRTLYEEVFGCPSNNLSIAPDAEADPDRRHRFQNWVERRATREPLHYVIGHRKFWSLDFKVTPQVLIPRLETEVLISHFLEIEKSYSGQSHCDILDVCTGSGIIAVVAAKELPGSQVVAVDISRDSLTVAEENSRKHGVSRQIRFLISDLFEQIHRENLGPFDFILSNPPYIKVDCIEGLIPEIKNHEPRRTFDGGEDGLKFYRVIVSEAAGFLKVGGYLIVETGFGVHGPVCDLLRKTGNFEEPLVLSDFNDYPRVISARKK